MTKKQCDLFIDTEPYSFEVEGDFFWGEEELLFKEEDNIISKMPWYEDGYAVVNAFLKEEFQVLKQSITNCIIEAIKANNIKFAKQK